MNETWNERCHGGQIGVLDSGIGGITVLSALLDRMPHENYIYLADRKGLPYGDKTNAYILDRTVQNCRRLMHCGVKAIVVACNTATNVGIAMLRKTEDFLGSCIYVGLEPAVKPALQAVRAGKILVLLTPATAQQEKFLELIAPYPKDRIVVSPQKDLALRIERSISCLESMRQEVYAILSVYPDVQGVVLGCTHYVLVKNMVEEFYGGSIPVFDGNEGAANRLYHLLRENGLLCGQAGNGGIRFLETE